MNPSLAALALAELNIPVFPCSARKTPTTRRGFHDASTDADAVRQMWRDHHGPLIGVPTGDVSGFDALDIDPRHGGDVWWAKHRHLIPRTRQHRTRSGGRHVMFRRAAGVRNSESKVAPGVDTRGEGGYVIWWPATGQPIADHPIAAWPAWLLERLLAKPVRPEPAIPAAYRTTDDADAPQRVADSIVRRLASAVPGQRHYSLRKAAYTLGGLLDRLPVGEAEAIRMLVDAVSQAGAEDLENAKKTAAWGIAQGRAEPLSLTQEAR